LKTHGGIVTSEAVRQNALQQAAWLLPIC